MSKKEKSVPAEIVRANDELRMKLVSAFANRRVARAEMSLAQTTIELTIAQIDTSGVLRKAIRNSQVCGQKLTESDLKLAAVLEEIQKSTGQDITGLVVNPDDGTLTPPPPSPEK